MTSSLQNRRILLVVTGGIAAYKSLELVRLLKDDGAEVSCVLTAAGEKFVTKLSLATLSGAPVHTDMWDQGDEARLDHIRLSRDVDAILIAPATADFMAKLALGLADDLASTLLLAAGNTPLFLAPAMNCRMWAHPATQANAATLRARGCTLIGPEEGFLACGEEGAGRMSAPADLHAALAGFFARGLPLAGKKALVTSGPTFEPLDPVRFIGNRSSGKQGHAIAAALAALGATVTLVTGPTAEPAPQGVQTHPIETAREMLDACLAALPADIVVCAAAVADWRPAQTANAKMKKTKGAAPTLKLTENPDILASLSQLKKGRPKLVVGFAAETAGHGSLDTLAKEKRARKKCDWIVLNDVSGAGVFGKDLNKATLFRATGKAKDAWPQMTKKALADKLALEIAAVFQAAPLSRTKAPLSRSKKD